jgi:hypothetical protein
MPPALSFSIRKEVFVQAGWLYRYRRERLHLPDQRRCRFHGKGVAVICPSLQPGELVNHPSITTSASTQTILIKTELIKAESSQ